MNFFAKLVKMEIQQIDTTSTLPIDPELMVSVAHWIQLQ